MSRKGLSAVPNFAESRERIRLLLRIDAILRDSVGVGPGLGAMVELLVPALADWCVVDLVDGGQLRRVAAAHRDPERRELLRPWVGRPIESEAAQGPSLVLRNGRLLHLPAADDPALVAPDRSAAGTVAVRQLGLGAITCVPMKQGGALLGVLTCVRCPDSVSLCPSELAFLRTIAGRGAEVVARSRRLQEAEAASRAKDEFLAMLGHELRNPLAAIRNSVRGLERLGRSSDAGAELRGIISRQVEHMTRLVDDLLDVTRLQSGKLVLRVEPVDLAAVAARSVDSLRESGRATDHDVTLEAESAVVGGDPIRLEQVCANLLDNAVKYTPPGGRIAVVVERDGEHAVLRVRDTGVGIAPGMLSRVFDLFAQGEQSLDRPAGGLGIGLSLVRRLVELHGGQVSAQSPGPGHGATFEFRLALSAARVSPPAAPAAVSSRPRHILLVEDNADVRHALRLLLESEGHRVDAVGSGPEAVDVAERLLPEIMLVDIGLPGMDGYQVARRVRTIRTGRAIVLVALTGYGQPEARRLAVEAGFDLHLVKPVDPERLARAIAGAGRRPSVGRAS